MRYLEALLQASMEAMLNMLRCPRWIEEPAECNIIILRLNMNFLHAGPADEEICGHQQWQAGPAYV